MIEEAIKGEINKEGKTVKKITAILMTFVLLFAFGSAASAQHYVKQAKQWAALQKNII